MVKDRFVRQMWIGLGIIVASIALAAGAIFYYANDLSAQADGIVNDRTAMQRQTDSVTDLANLEHSVPQAAQYQVAMDRLLPDQYGLVTFGQWVSQLGQKHNVNANAQFQGAVTAPTGITLGNAGFSFDAEGSPADLASFLDEMTLKSSGFLLTLGSFDFTSNGTDSKVTGQGTVFFR